jgi:hypothetical protein
MSKGRELFYALVCDGWPIQAGFWLEWGSLTDCIAIWNERQANNDEGEKRTGTIWFKFTKALATKLS